MIAIKRLQNIMWILIVAFGALTAYLISLRVATERNAVQALERNIAHVRGDIRYLETEFEARANMRQLEQWNSKDYRYGAPQVAQYLPDERALAHLQGVQSNGDVYVAPPVMMAMAETPATEPQKAAVTASPSPVQIREDDSMLRVAAASPTASAPVKDAAPAAPKRMPVKAAEKPAVRTAQAASPRLAPGPATPSPVARKAARMALLDSQLLDDRTLRDLGARAQAENRSRLR